MNTTEIKKGNAAEETQGVDKEVDDIVEEISTSAYEWTRKLSKPITYGEKTYEELRFNFGKLTAQDGLNIESELNAIGKTMFAEPAFDVNYLIRVAARACEEENAWDLLMRVPLVDFVSIRTKAKLFLLGRAL